MDPNPFAPTAHVYDLLYEAAGKDYAAEADALHDLIQSRSPGASSLLDVACLVRSSRSGTRTTLELHHLIGSGGRLRYRQQRVYNGDRHTRRPTPA